MVDPYIRSYGRHRREFRDGVALAVGEVAALDFQARLQVRDHAQDVGAQRAERVLQLQDGRAGRAAGRDQAVALQHEVVVAGDHLVHRVVFQAHVARNQAVGIGAAHDVVLEVVGQGQLGLHRHDFGVVAAAVAQIHVGRVVHVHDLVGTLEAGEFAFDAAQFLLDDRQALIDEVLGVYGDAVLLADGRLVVLDHEHVDDVGGTLRVVILLDQREDLLVVRDRQAGDVRLGGPVDRNLLDPDGLAVLVRRVAGRGEEDDLAAATVSPSATSWEPAEVWSRMWPASSGITVTLTEPGSLFSRLNAMRTGDWEV